VDDNVVVLQLMRRTLGLGGFGEVLTAVDVPTALKMIETLRPVLVLVDLDLGSAAQSGIDLLRQLKPLPDGPIPVVLSGDKTPEQFFRAARAGAVDFLVKEPGVNISKEVRRLLDGERGFTHPRTLPQIVSDLGYLRSFGLTRKEIHLLTEFADGFPRLSDLADREKQSPVQLRKCFSRIYSKLNIPDLHQLIRILMTCELFNKEN
jgi:DNA-binding NarL/FixJ family response regulator